MSILQKQGWHPEVAALHASLLRERVLFDFDEPAARELLRQDVRRIAAAMEDESLPPPLLWTGIPWPEERDLCRGLPCLSLSVGGTRSVGLILRPEGEQVAGLNPNGEAKWGAELEALSRELSFPTPTPADVSDGRAMIQHISAEVGRRLDPLRGPLEACPHVVLAWGYPSRSRRTASQVVGGLTALCLRMTKEQAPFTPHLLGQDIGLLFRGALQRSLRWNRPVTVANDTVMALHRFLSPENRKSTARIGLFINGTGTNFTLAEPYAVRPEGVVSREGEDYQPERLRPDRPLRPGESAQLFFVNYESGSLDLGATRTRFDLWPDYPFEMNALAGGHAFRQQFRELARSFLGPARHRELLEHFQPSSGAGPEPGGPDVSLVATGGDKGFEGVFPGAALSLPARAQVILLCQAILVRSALHAALVLAAVTERQGFGLGDARSERPDLLALEGSVWRTPGYPEEVRTWWQHLVAPRALELRLTHETGYNASLTGPAFLARVHR